MSSTYSSDTSTSYTHGGAISTSKSAYVRLTRCRIQSSRGSFGGALFMDVGSTSEVRDLTLSLWTAQVRVSMCLRLNTDLV